ncbi:ArgS-related anticodon-binding protein NrtL [Streptomyces sp. NPDC059788]|uniref:ArgS-related anticodon-binding protein NrtL n=1 Tax=Streptomyces sp. NPDC059788 TaxID=3346948 RepID=UPI00364D8C3E
MTPAEFSRAVLRSVRDAVEAGELSVTVPERVEVRAPAPRSGGAGDADLACNVALQVAKEARRAPREVAGVLRERLVKVSGVGGVEIAGAGFLNVMLTGSARAALVRSVLAQGRGYGSAGYEYRNAGQGHGSAGGEHGSTGHGHGGGAHQGRVRGAWPGRPMGQEPVVLRAAAGVRAAVMVEALERILPAGGVGVGPATGVKQMARGETTAAQTAEAAQTTAEAVKTAAQTTAEAAKAVADPAAEAPKPPHPPIEIVRPRPINEGFETEGSPRPDAPLPPSAAVPHDWRALTARLGSDEARWVLLRPAPQDAVRVPERPVQREGNGRFRVQYAYARTCAMTRNARELGFAAEPGDVGGSRVAREVWAAIAEYPGVVEAAARHRAPDRVARHLEVTADAWLRCHDVCPPLPVGEEKPSAVHRARLALAEAAGTVLANGLHLLGISTPDRL